MLLEMIKNFYSEYSNTRKSTNLWVGVIKKWAASRNIGEDMEFYEVQKLD
jgi:hypothetical protein